jgi:hypothetical protein
MQADAAGPGSAVELFSSLSGFEFVRHAFVGRLAGIDVATNREEALERLDAGHRAVRARLGMDRDTLATAEQIHGNRVTVIDAPLARDRCYEGADGLVTNQHGVSLGIYVADCCAVYLVDPARRAIGLMHSGKKGTELAIATEAVRQMTAAFGTNPADLVAQLSPCIRPPHYEVDFAAEIVRQLRAAGVEQIHDSGICTACDLSRYYSYRAEKGRTGRMLALLGLVP